MGEAEETSASDPTRIANLMKAAMADELSLWFMWGGLIMKGGVTDIGVTSYYFGKKGKK